MAKEYTQKEYDRERKEFFREYAKGPRPLGAYRLKSESLRFHEEDPDVASKGPRHRKRYPMYGKR